MFKYNKRCNQKVLRLFLSWMNGVRHGNAQAAGAGSEFSAPT